MVTEQVSDELAPAVPWRAGLLAFARLHRARANARFTHESCIIVLADQDRSQWDQAAIVACHAEAWGSTD
jgi:predicted RNA polymerase sigma factor